MCDNNLYEGLVKPYSLEKHCWLEVEKISKISSAEVFSKSATWGTADIYTTINKNGYYFYFTSDDLICYIINIDIYKKLRFSEEIVKDPRLGSNLYNIEKVYKHLIPIIRNSMLEKFGIN